MHVKYLCKLVGALFVVAGTVGAGICVIGERRNGLFYAEKTLQLLKSIRHLLVYEKRTLAEACERLAKEKEAPFADCFCRIVSRIQTHEGESFSHIWESEFLQETENLYFTKEETEKLIKVPACMMASEPVRTAQLLDDTILFFEERVKGRKEQSGNRERVILSVCMMAGVLIGILFW